MFRPPKIHISSADIQLVSRYLMKELTPSALFSMESQSLRPVAAVLRC